MRKPSAIDSLKIGSFLPLRLDAVSLAPALFLAAVLLMSGCADPPGPSAGPLETRTNSATPSATTVITSDETVALGAISGVVVDDELVAVPNADVTLVGFAEGVRTGEDGAFLFDGVPAGDHQIDVRALGFLESARKVSVAPEERTEIQVVLERVYVAEPRIVVIPHNLRIPAGAAGYYGQGVVSCDGGCDWTAEFAPAFSHLIVEFFGRHSTPSPLEPTRLTAELSKNKDGKDFWFCQGIPVYEGMNQKDCRLPIKANFTGEALAGVAPLGKPMDALRVRIACEYGWFCVDEKYEVWVSLFYDYHDSAIPLNYSAKPVT